MAARRVWRAGSGQVRIRRFSGNFLSVLAVVCAGGRLAPVRWIARCLLLLLLVAGGGAWWFREPLGEWLTRRGLPVVVVEAPPTPDPERYGVMVKDLARWRLELAQAYRAAGDPAVRRSVEADARMVLELALPEMMRCWLGTPWDFHGTAERPGEGRIACGYFVSTVLRDAGFRVDRFKLAQQPSENILRTFLPRAACTLTVGKSYEEFSHDAARLEPGIYVIGLDTHVAFLVVPGDGGFRFVHASGSKPWCVVDEGRDEAEVLKRSSWRMLGNLTADSNVLRRWLAGEPIAVRGT